MNKLVVGLACVALGVVGCGKTDGGNADDGGTPGDEVLSAEPSKPLADLTDADVVEVCEGIADLYADARAYVRGICILEAAESSDDVQSCDAAVEACVGDLEIEPLDMEECAKDLEFTGCDATVGQLNDCLAAQRRNTEKVSELRNCEDADRKGASTDWLQDVPACEELVDQCPEAFERSDRESDGTDGGTPLPEETSHSITGDLGGETVDIRPTDGLGASHSSTNGYWTASQEFGGAVLWLWGETDLGQGLIQMPPSGPEASNWLCLEAVEVAREADGTGEWKSNALSVLPRCDQSDPQTLELSFVIGEAVNGTLGREPVSWVSSGFECLGGSGCSLEFEEADTAWTGRARWILEVDTSLVEGTSNTFEHATLIHPSGSGAVACGGSGFVEWGENNQFRIQVDDVGRLAECPGAPIEGELSGKY